MTTLSLEASKKVYEIVGEYETESFWTQYASNARKGTWHVSRPINWRKDAHKIQAPNFAELIRVLSKIGEKRDGYNDEEDWVTLAYVEVTRAYMGAPTEPEGMAAVETYLMKLL